MKEVIVNNQVKIKGEITSDFVFSHEVFGERFYKLYVNVKRRNDIVDRFPVIVSERLVDITKCYIGECIKVKGQFRSFNKKDGNRSKLLLAVYAREFEFVENDKYCYETNLIFLDGYICKKPVYRETPLGREIADLFIASNRPYGKSDYIPCICWGRNAKFVSELQVGTHIQLVGRIQSREYQKKLSDTECETRVAYEVSVNKIKTLEE